MLYGKKAVAKRCSVKKVLLKISYFINFVIIILLLIIILLIS